MGIVPLNDTEAVLWASLSLDIACRVVVIGSDDCIRDANPGAERYFGLARQQIVGQSIFDLYPAHTRTRGVEWLAETRAKDGVQDPATPAHHVFHGYHWQLTARPITWRGEPGCILSVGQIVTEPTPFTELMSRALQLEDRDIGLGALAVLTDRELEVAMLISGGKSDLEVAQALHRSLRTVHSHRSSVGRKLGLQRRADLTHFLSARGMVACAQQGPLARGEVFHVSNGVVRESVPNFTR